MNIITTLAQTNQIKKIIQRIRFTQHTVILWGMAVCAVCATGIIIWDGALFLESIAPLEPQTETQTKQISLTSQDIDDAMQILNQRQKRFNTLIIDVAGTSTISF